MRNCIVRLKRQSRPAVITLLLLTAGAVSGCASAARQIGAAAAPPALDSALAQSNKPETQRKIQQLSDSPALQHVGRSVGEGVGIGLFEQANKYADELQAAGATPQAQLQNSTTQPATPSSTQPTTQPGGLLGLLTGSSGGFINTTIQEAFAAAYNPKFREGEMKLSEAIGEGFVTGMITVFNRDGPAIGETVRQQLGPIMQMVIKEEIAPAVGDVLQHQLAPIIADTLQHQLAPAALDVWKQGVAATAKLTVRPDIQPDVIQNAQNASLGASRGTHEALVEAGWIGPNGGIAPSIRFYLRLGLVGAVIIGALLILLLLLVNILVLRTLTRRPKAGS